MYVLYIYISISVSYLYLYLCLISISLSLSHIYISISLSLYLSFSLHIYLSIYCIYIYMHIILDFVLFPLIHSDASLRPQLLWPRLLEPLGGVGDPYEEGGWMICKAKQPRKVGMKHAEPGIFLEKLTIQSCNWWICDGFLMVNTGITSGSPGLWWRYL